jgi:tRNA-dihydrouridine synthase B
MRLGWDDDNLTAPDLARALEGAGVAAIFVHGRTREQGFGGTVNLAGIRKVVEAVENIPVIGNGDIVTPQAAKKMLDETGCAGVSIGRGAFYDPWIFRRTLEYLNNCSSRCEEALTNPLSNDALPPEPSFDERIRVMRRHLDLMIEVFGEELGCRMFRKVAPWYSKRFGPCHEFNKKIVQFATREQFETILENYIRWRSQFLDDRGDLQPRYQPAPMVASFMRDPASTQREHIPVPKGPVEVW